MHTERRVFDQGSHEDFARACFDYNPIHMDVIAARRTSAGTPIVHGIHSLLWLLDRFSASELFSSGAVSLKVQFSQAIYVGDEVTLEITKSTPNVVRARIMVGDEEVVACSLGFDEVSRPSFPFIRPDHSVCTIPPSSPADLRLEEMEGLTGCLSFSPMLPMITTMFPSATRAFGARRVVALACSSCLVGMVVPGLHSMYSGLSVSFCQDDIERNDALDFAVLSVVKRFRSVRIGISGPGLRGSLEALNRMPPVSQPSIESLTRLVSKDEFRSSTALIIGGSRGLGELTAKLIAAGGGRVFITYASGKLDAEAVIAEMRQAGSKCAALSYDIYLPAAQQLAKLDESPTHLYYFATPRIFRRKTGVFDAGRFDEFNSYYITSLFDVVQACRRLRPAGIRVFHPSSTFVEERPAAMTEYSMSKAAAEVLCADLSKFAPGVHIITHRLPRLPTDQNNSVVHSTVGDPIAVMLPIVREMHR